jgi:hypothetical protein
VAAAASPVAFDPKDAGAKVRIHAWMTVCGALAFGGGCSSSSAASSNSGTGDDGGAVVMCHDQACEDTGAAYTLANLVNALFTQNLGEADAATGNQSLTAMCPVGGSAMITGTTAFDTASGLTTVNLTYAMMACQVSAPHADLTYTGTVTETGTFVDNGMQSLAEASSSLTVAGTVGGVAVSDGACMVHMTIVGNNLSPTVTGMVCGRAF